MLLEFVLVVQHDVAGTEPDHIKVEIDHRHMLLGSPHGGHRNVDIELDSLGQRPFRDPPRVVRDEDQEVVGVRSAYGAGISAPGPRGEPNTCVVGPETIRGKAVMRTVAPLPEVDVGRGGDATSRVRPR